MPGEVADVRHRLLTSTHCDVAEDVDGVVPTTEFQFATSTAFISPTSWNGRSQ
ncbi:MAG: hypothetical protein ACYCU7_15810 [Acidimicrobiales bacterium]